MSYKCHSEFEAILDYMRPVSINISKIQTIQKQNILYVDYQELVQLY